MRGGGAARASMSNQKQSHAITCERDERGTCLDEHLMEGRWQVSGRPMEGQWKVGGRPWNVVEGVKEAAREV